MARVFTPGRYRVRITKWALGETSTEKPQIVWTFMVEGRLEGGKLVACPQYERSCFRVITDNTADWVIQELKHFGYDRDSFDAISPEHPQAFNFAGKEVDAEVEYETYEGKERERWKFITGAGFAVKPIARQGVSKLNAAFGAKLKALGSGMVNSTPSKPISPAASTASVPSANGAVTPSALQQEADEVF